MSFFFELEGSLVVWNMRTYGSILLLFTWTSLRFRSPHWTKTHTHTHFVLLLICLFMFLYTNPQSKCHFAYSVCCALCWTVCTYCYFAQLLLCRMCLISPIIFCSFLRTELPSQYYHVTCIYWTMLTLLYYICLLCHAIYFDSNRIVCSTEEKSLSCLAFWLLMLLLHVVCVYFKKLYLLLHSNRLKLIPYSAYAAYILQFSFHSQSKLVHRAFCQRKYTDYQAWGHEYVFCLFSLFSSSCMLHYCYIHTMISSDFFLLLDSTTEQNDNWICICILRNHRMSSRMCVASNDKEKRK